MIHAVKCSVQICQKPTTQQCQRTVKFLVYLLGYLIMMCQLFRLRSAKRQNNEQRFGKNTGRISRCIFYENKAATHHIRQGLAYSSSRDPLLE